MGAVNNIAQKNRHLNTVQNMRLSSSVKEARDKLGHKQGTDRFQYELLRMFARNELTASLSIPLFAVILAVSISIWAPLTLVSIWVGTVFVSKGVILIICRRFTDLPRPKVNLKLWRQRLIVAETFYGLSWAGIVLIAAGTKDPVAHVFIFASFIAVISIRMMFASTIMPLVLAGTAPMTFGLVIHFLALQEPFYWALAAMVVGIHVYLIYLMSGLNSTVYAMLEYRAEKDILIGRLEEAKAFSDDARHRAEEANLAKSRFLATMSHELRTPLNAILGFSEVMKTEVFGPHSNPTYKEYATDIHNSGNHLLNLINEILDLSRIEAERYELHEQTVKLADIAEDCQHLISMRARNKDITLNFVEDKDLTAIWVDERAIRQVVLNLLSNAVKFTPPNGTITLTIGGTHTGGQYLTVADTGPGIPEDEIEKVLKPFGQGSLAHQTAEGGTGLGLAICQKLITLHDGEFKLTSELRHGTTVRIEIPSKRVMQGMAALDPNAPLSLKSQAQPLDRESKEFEELTQQIQRIIKSRQIKRDIMTSQNEEVDEDPLEILRTAARENKL
ncbi:MAG: two-component sensor histidine kinase [Rhodomicrobium sp.]|nr:MAG: two-component sensor histidine kinase [Rhodomicrobium sp.]